MTANGVMLRIVKARPCTPVQYSILGGKHKIEKAAGRLAERGVHPERFGFFKQDDLGIWTAPNGNNPACFKDPDGNTLSLSEPAKWN